MAQVGEDNIKLSDVRRSAYDPDELEDEQRERDRRNKMNKLYKKFAIQIQDEAQKTAHSLELDIPYKDLCFTGRASLKGARCDTPLDRPNAANAIRLLICLFQHQVVPFVSPLRQSQRSARLGLRSRGESFFMPTKDCLVDLSEPPFFMLDTNELEIAYFERVSHNLKYFDMVFVCKDYETWVRIDAIPSKKLENVKTWIDSINVRTLSPCSVCSCSGPSGPSSCDASSIASFPV